MNKTEDTGNTDAYTPSFRLGSVKNTRAALAKIINAYSKDKLKDPQKYRNLIYGLSYLLQAHRLEHEIIEFEDLKAKIEILLKEQNHENGQIKKYG
jgi:hypothetical protein